jgi:hypothetical protein
MANTYFNFYWVFQVLLLHDNNLKDLKGGGDLKNLSQLRVRLILKHVVQNN